MILGAAMLDGETQTGKLVGIPTKMLNRHGLIAGATGTGKTKTLQILAEQMSKLSIPTLLMDIKGDLSGVAVPSGGHPKIDERHAAIGFDFEASGSPVEFLSLSDEPGVRLRATATEFGPVLLSKVLDLSEAQRGVMAILFKYCDDNELPLLDLEDLKKTLQFMRKDAKADIEENYGYVSPASLGAIMRKIVEIENQGAEAFFGEPSFDVDDLVRINDEGRGMISILRLTDIQDRPKLFSTFMLQLLAEIYATFPEEGDSDVPKLCIFIDEAHLVFNEASEALLEQIEAIIKLIRSKGVGIYFCTQNPTDIPDSVLSQLGLKIQHALRAFTAKDRKAIKKTAENYPVSDYYKVDELLTSLGIGEAFVTSLNEKGIPTPLAHTMLRAPESRMDVLTDKEIKSIIKKSEIIDKYNKEVDRESAAEVLTKRIQEAKDEEKEAKRKADLEKAKKSSSRSTRSRSRSSKSGVEKMVNNTMTRQIGRTVARELTRGLLGMLGIKRR